MRFFLKAALGFFILGVGYHYTDIFFQVKKIPLPFQGFGILVGGSLFCWAMALVSFIEAKFSKKGGASMKKWGLAFLVFTVFTALSLGNATADDSVSSEKLDKVLKGQEEILKQLADIKESLEVVKVRASLAVR